MTVLRIKHENNYVVLHKELLENPQISLKAKGLWAFCMAKPDNWEFHVTQLEATLLEGRDALYSALHELIKFGYCKKVQAKDSTGRFGAVDYEMYETTQLKKCLPQTGFPLTDRPLTDNPQLTSIDCHQVQKDNNKDRSVGGGVEDVDGIKEALERNRIPKERHLEALTLWYKHKEAIKKLSKGSAVGYLIWMIREGKNPFQEKEAKLGRAAARREWAYKNEATTNAGAYTATPTGFEYVSGSVVVFYPYDQDSEFWANRGLAEIAS